MAITIKDLAKLANVSKGTVSRVINGSSGVGAETRQRILKLIKDLDYQPNISARGLAAKRSYNIGMIIPHTGNYSLSSSYWSALLTAVNEQVMARGYNLLFSTARAQDDVASSYRTILKRRCADGLIIGADQFGEEHLAELLTMDFPFVTVGKTPNNSVYYVDVDNRGGARQMTEYLLDQGHRKIALLTGPLEYPYVQERIQGFSQVMMAAGLSPHQIFHCPYQIQAAKEKTKDLLKLFPETTAIFAACSELVWGVIKAAQEMKIKIPDDLSLVSFDDHPLFEVFSPEITAVSQRINEVGRTAAERLFELVEGAVPAQKGIVLSTEIIVRRSCANRCKSSHPH
ncbi:MAG TPA: LacI family transcriptional regulator [Firmicutes bacterium]|nr:LacI family transcriptional regulator [Bacillota bacterium]